MSWSSSCTGLCWSLAHLMQCRPDELSWTWTQTWVQAWMLDYSLKWTARSSAIQMCLSQSAGAVEYTDCTSAECPGYDTKQSDHEVPVMLGLWGMQSTPSLPLLPGPLWAGMVLFTNPSARAGYDTRSIFKRSFNRFEFRVFLLLD